MVLEAGDEERNGRSRPDPETLQATRGARPLVFVLERFQKDGDRLIGKDLLVGEGEGRKEARPAVGIAE